MPNYVWLILFVAGVIISFIGGKKVELRAFCKELGEGFLAIDEFLGKMQNADATPEEKIEVAEKLKKEWLDVVKAGGALFGKIMNKLWRAKE